MSWGRSVYFGCVVTAAVLVFGCSREERPAGESAPAGGTQAVDPVAAKRRTLDSAMEAYAAQKYDEAFRLFEELAKAGDDRGKTYLIRFYLDGLGVEKDPAKAFYWAEQSAKTGSPTGEFFLGNLYAKGEGVERNDEQAVFWYRKAAEGQYPMAYWQLGVHNERGLGVAKNQEEAVRWFCRAAESNVRVARDKVRELQVTPEQCKAAIATFGGKS